MKSAVSKPLTRLDAPRVTSYVLTANCGTVVSRTTLLPLVFRPWGMISYRADEDKRGGFRSGAGETRVVSLTELRGRYPTRAGLRGKFYNWREVSQ